MALRSGSPGPACQQRGAGQADGGEARGLRYLDDLDRVDPGAGGAADGWRTRQREAAARDAAEDEVITAGGRPGVQDVFGKRAGECRICRMFLRLAADRVGAAAAVHAALDVDVNVVGGNV